MIKLSPSILAADFVNLERDINKVAGAGAEYIHIDVMDGHFVPNISIGVPVVKAIRGITGAVLDVHLMIDNASRYVDVFAAAGADILTVHIEAADKLPLVETLAMIRGLGKRAGLSVKPGTDIEALREYLPLCDLCLVMTVEPGFGGQKFIPHTMRKIAAARRLIDEVNPGCELEIDGGVDMGNLKECLQNGADTVVMGSAIFGGDAAVNVARMKQISSEF